MTIESIAGIALLVNIASILIFAVTWALSRGSGSRQSFWTAIHAESEARINLERDINKKINDLGEKILQGRHEFQLQINSRLTALDHQMALLGGRVDKVLERLPPAS